MAALKSLFGGIGANLGGAAAAAGQDKQAAGPMPNKWESIFRDYSQGGF